MSLKKTTELEGIGLNEYQINHFAAIYREIKEGEEQMSDAIIAFKEFYEIKDGDWSRKDDPKKDLSFAKKTYTVKKEIARVGTFTDMYGRIVKMTAESLAGMVEAFKQKIRTDGIPFKLGHGGEVREGYPAIGWLTNLEVVGDRLMSTISNIPRAIKEFVESKSYRTVSPEISTGYKEKGYALVLTALSILGEDAPAISNLDEFSKFFKEAGRELLFFSTPKKEILIMNFETNDEGKIVEKYRCQCIECGYKMESEEHCNDIECPECGAQMRREARPGIGRANFEEGIMDEKQNQVVEKLQTEVVQLKEELTESEKAKNLTLKENQELKDNIALSAKESKEKEIKLFLETDEITKRVLPNQREDYTVILMSVEGDDFEKKKKEIKGFPEIISFKEEGSADKKTDDEKLSEKQTAVEESIRLKEGKNVELGGFKLSEQAEVRAQEIMKDNKVSHNAAYEMALVELSV